MYKEGKKKHAVLGLARMSAMCQKEGCPERIGIRLVYTIEGAIIEYQGCFFKDFSRLYCIFGTIIYY